jgi:hypothetical protein
MMEFTEQRAAVLLELHTMIKAYRLMQDLIDAGNVSREFAETCESLGFEAMAYRKLCQITPEEEKQFSKAIKRGEHGNH